MPFLPLDDLLVREQAESANAGLILPGSVSYLKSPLQQQAIPQAAIPDSTNHISFVNTLGESTIWLAPISSL
jgi:hypothetical protein